MIEICRVDVHDKTALEAACSLLERAQDHETSESGIRFNTHGLTPQQLETDLVSGNGTLLLAFEDCEPIGTLTIVNDVRRNWYRRHETSPRLIKYVAVLPERQGRGIAGLLVQEAIDLADELISVSTDSLNRHAVHLYEKKGFSRVEISRGRGTQSNAVRLAHWRHGCPWSPFTIKAMVFLSKMRCVVKAAIRY